MPELAERVRAGGDDDRRARLIAIAALAKSAQVPLHFWLPRAMEAPTPVSAYLHSAAMVAAGVLVLGRVHPLLAVDPLVLDGLVVVGFASILVGGVLALGQDELKQILAHSTISQYGYVVVLYGLGGAAGAAAAAFYVVAHAIAKSALFMTAGAVTEATGESRLSHLGGLARSMPALAIASGIAVGDARRRATDHRLLQGRAVLHRRHRSRWACPDLAVAAAALTVAYIGRFWLGLFTGPRRTASDPHPRAAGHPGRPARGGRVGGRHRGRAIRRARRSGAASVSHGEPLTSNRPITWTSSREGHGHHCLGARGRGPGLSRAREPSCRPLPG